MKLSSVGDRVIVEPIEEDAVTAAGVIIPDVAKEVPSRGKVLSVGRDCDDLQEGDEVIYSKYSGTELRVNDRELLVLKPDSVFAKVA